MKSLEAKMPAAFKEQLRMVLVSFDPKNDDVKRLKELQQAHAVDDRWSFVRVDDPDAVQELAAILGVKYRFLPNGQINHSSVITLLDGDGVIRARMDGVGQADETILDAVPRLSKR
jgi:protein SCO1/2